LLAVVRGGPSMPASPEPLAKMRQKRGDGMAIRRAFISCFGVA